MVQIPDSRGIQATTQATTQAITQTTTQTTTQAAGADTAHTAG